MSPEPDIDLRDRVAKLEAALMAITSKNSPQSSHRPSAGTTVASGTEAAKAQGLYSPTSESLYSVCAVASVANIEYPVYRS